MSRKRAVTAAVDSQNAAVDALASAKADAEARGQAALQLATANGKRFDQALARTRAASATTCAEAMPVVDDVLESIRLRRGGARRGDRDIQADPGAVGHVSMATVGVNREMKLHAAGDDSQRMPIIPLLLDPSITAMHGNRQLFSGLERQGDQSDSSAPLFVQEWAVEILAEPPSELAETPHRPLA